MPVSPEDIAALIDGLFSNQTPRWEDLPSDPVRRVTLLRRAFPVDAIPAILELSELRHRAGAKFSRAEGMFFDREALEQATHEDVARHRARQFRGTAETIADLTCGIGGDAIALAGLPGARLTACDLSPARVRITRANIEQLLPDSAGDVRFRTAPAEDYPAAEAYVLDPSRRASGRRSRHLAGMSPAAGLIVELSKKAEAMAVKLSPATPDEELALLGGRLEFVSHRGDCREAVVWFGKAGPDAARSAAIIGGPAMMSMPGTARPEVSPPLRFLLEPDPAIVRAGLIPELCAATGAAVMDERVAYLTSGGPGPAPLVRSYEIVRSLPFSLKAVRAVLREIGAGRVEVKKRATAVDVPSVQRQLQSTLPGSATVVLTRIGAKPWAFVCNAVSQADLRGGDEDLRIG